VQAMKPIMISYDTKRSSEFQNLYTCMRGHTRKNRLNLVSGL